jgi:hypothetical protein
MALENNAMIPLPIIIRRVMQTEIDMTDMHLGDDFVLLLAQVLHELPHVEHLNISGNKLTDEGLKDILGVRGSAQPWACKHVLTYSPCHQCATLIEPTEPHMMELYMLRTGPDADWCAHQDAQRVTQQAVHAGRLRSARLRRVPQLPTGQATTSKRAPIHISTIGSLSPLHALYAPSHLPLLVASDLQERLILSNSDLDDYEIVPLMDALESNRQITYVDLSYNLCGAKDKLRRGAGAILHGAGGQAIGRAIEINTAITHLDLSWNKMGPER